LRKHAETLMESRKDCQPGKDVDKTQELIRELQTTQIELELQAEQLRQSELELLISKMRYTALYDFAPIGYISLDRRGVILEANLTFADMLAVERASLIGRPVSNHIVFDHRDIFHTHLKTLSPSHPKQTCELQMETAGPNPLEVHLETTMVLKEAPDPEQYRTVILDITQRKRAEAALQKSELKYRSMMESMTDPVYICSPDFTMEYANPAMIKRLGRDATGEACHDALHGLDHRCAWCVFDKVAAGNSIETTIVSPFDGRNYRVTNMPIQHQNGTVSKMSIFRDITDYLAAVVEKNKVLSQLRQSQKLESIGSLAGGIAHDFNNILHPILGFAEMSLEDLPETHPVRENLKDIIQGAKRARDLVKQILSFSSQRETEQKPLLLKPLIQEALKLIRASIPANIEIRQELYDMRDHVWANPTEIHEIVLNLCTNAYHAMEHSGGTLWVRLNRAVPGPDLNLPPGDYCCLCISDTGMGIRPETIEKIFDPYFTTKALGKGSGLGLSVVHGIVKKYQGAIAVESLIGKGTVFRVYLPLTLSMKKSDNKQIVPSRPGGDEKILLVDDEAPIVKIGVRILEKLGYKVTGASGSLEALELFTAAPHYFDLVITDMAMPAMVGTQLAQRLIQTRPDIPIIICTGFSEKIDPETAAFLGIKDYINKPFLTIDLASKVRAVLDQAKKNTPAPPL